MMVTHLALSGVLLLPVNSLTPAQQQQQYERLMQVQSTINKPDQPFYNHGYSTDTNVEPNPDPFYSKPYSGQPSQSTPALPQPAPPTTGFSPSLPGFGLTPH